MAEPRPAARLLVVADLRVEVSDARGLTAARLFDESGGLVLDTDDPAVLLRSVPGRGLARDLPIRLPTELAEGVSVRLTSRGRDLGVVEVSRGGRVRLRPTVTGLLVAARVAGSYGTGRRVGWAVSATAPLLAVVYVIWRRRTR